MRTPRAAVCVRPAGAGGGEGVAQPTARAETGLPGVSSPPSLGLGVDVSLDGKGYRILALPLLTPSTPEPTLTPLLPSPGKSSCAIL